MNTERLIELARFTVVVEPGPNVMVSISTEELRWFLVNTGKGRGALKAVAVEVEGRPPMTIDELRENSEPIIDEEPS